MGSLDNDLLRKIFIGIFVTPIFILLISFKKIRNIISSVRISCKQESNEENEESSNDYHELEGYFQENSDDISNITKNYKINNFIVKIRKQIKKIIKMKIKKIRRRKKA